MAITFPTTLDTLTNPTGTDLLENSNAALDHDVQHSNANDAIEALEAKVGVNSSAVTTSHDYKLGEVTGSDKAVGKTATQTLTNKTLTSPTITGATATSTSVNGVTLSTAEGTTKFLRGDGTYTTPTAGDASYAAKGSVQGLTDAATSGLVLSSGVISVNSGTSANNIVKLDASAKLPAVDGSALTNIESYSPNTMGVTSYFTQILPMVTTSSTTISGWTLASTGTMSVTQNGAGAGVSMAGSGGSGDFTATTGWLGGYSVADSKIIRLSFAAKVNDLSDRKGWGLVVTAANIHTAQTDTTNGEIRFILNGSTLYAQNANGTTATSTDVSSGITMTNFNTYTIIFDPGVDIKYYINGVLKATHTTNLPTSGTLLIAYGANTNTRTVTTTPPVVSVEI